MNEKIKKIAIFCAAIFILASAVVIGHEGEANAQVNIPFKEELREAKRIEDMTRRTQFNVFCVPVKTENLIWRCNFNYHNFTHKVTLSYMTPPKAKTAEEFAELEKFAKRFIGVPYLAGGKTPSEGFDCSGFVLYVYSHCGSNLSVGGSDEQYKTSYLIPEESAAPGDLCFFFGTGNNPDSTLCSHVGIYLGDGKMIHAGMQGITISDLQGEYWKDHPCQFGRPF